MLQIRKPEAEELQNLLLLLLKFGDDFKDIFPEADVIKVGQVIQQHYDDGFISNAYINDKLVGSIGAMKTPWWFSKQEFVAETWFYVLPEHRSYKIAKKLKKYCKLLNCTFKKVSIVFKKKKHYWKSKSYGKKISSPSDL